jgi:hypothetical protein
MKLKFFETQKQKERYNCNVTGHPTRGSQTIAWVTEVSTEKKGSIRGLLLVSPEKKSALHRRQLQKIWSNC